MLLNSAVRIRLIAVLLPELLQTRDGALEASVVVAGHFVVDVVGSIVNVAVPLVRAAHECPVEDLRVLQE